MQKKFFISEKIKKYRKCPALGLVRQARSWVASKVSSEFQSTFAAGEIYVLVVLRLIRNKER